MPRSPRSLGMTSQGSIFKAVATNGSSPIRMKTSRGQGGVTRIPYCVLRNDWTEYAIRTFAASPNVGLALLILILIRILFT